MRQEERERSKQYRNLRWLIQLKNHVKISNPRGKVLLSFQRRRQPGLRDRGRRGPGGCLTVTRLDCLGLGSAHLPHLGLLRWSDWHFRSIFYSQGRNCRVKLPSWFWRKLLGPHGNRPTKQYLLRLSYTQDPRAGPAHCAKLRKRSELSSWGMKTQAYTGRNRTEGPNPHWGKDLITITIIRKQENFIVPKTVLNSWRKMAPVYIHSQLRFCMLPQFTFILSKWANHFNIQYNNAHCMCAHVHSCLWGDTSLPHKECFICWHCLLRLHNYWHLWSIYGLHSLHMYLCTMQSNFHSC